ncbi:hypothetical protein Riv7116_3730 [Rivularia sp. PCC 7116]|uniref:hypothetical protein n=1 Tax=Rivularia sp. PCC 7116 TaxID=373994 RepID=UPI00029F008C|nr:hypothetical protein [Rivularia sp. PCC 7116]AFY56175.1 hypothetical protein Riv7116_3730 [Rivularia sp. PCC 7116]
MDSHQKFDLFTEDNKFIILNNIVFNTNQIKDKIIEDFKQKRSSFNFCRKNKFLRKYFKEVKNQAIFNRIEWKFLLKKDIQCELIEFDEIKLLDELEIRIILDFSSAVTQIENALDPSIARSDSYGNINIKVLLDFSTKELESPEQSGIDNIETICFKNLYEQNIAYFHSLSSEEICI